MKVAMLWLINDKNEVLIARRAGHLDSDPGLWGPSVSGQIEKGESALEAIVREAQEELGLEPSVLSPTFGSEISHEHHDGEVREFTIFHARIKDSLVDFFPESSEVEEIRWISIEDLRKLLATKSNEVLISSAGEVWTTILDGLDAATV